jgi:predicted nucleotidyltransferase
MVGGVFLLQQVVLAVTEYVKLEDAANWTIYGAECTDAHMYIFTYVLMLI